MQDNLSSGNTTGKLVVYPAISATIGSAADGTLTGSVRAWRANRVDARGEEPSSPSTVRVSDLP